MKDTGASVPFPPTPAAVPPGAPVSLLGPAPPPWFEANGCGPKFTVGDVKGIRRWLRRFAAWALETLVPDNLYGCNLGPACDRHDWHYRLCSLFRWARGGDREARAEIRRYFAWLEETTGEKWEVWEIEVSRGDSDAYFRRNVCKQMKAGGARPFTAWRVSLVYWIGVRVGGGPAAS